MKKLWIIISVCWLWTCGGGGGGSSPTEPEPPQLPTVQNINLEATEDTPKTFTFVGTEPNNLSLAYSISTQPQNGTVQVSGSAGTYTPNENFNGQDTFLYIATSSSGNSNIGTVLVNVSSVDDQPIHLSQSLTTEEDTNLKIVFEYEEFDGQDVKFTWGAGAKNGTAFSTCAQCGGVGQVRMQQGFFQVQQTCPTCHGSGQSIKVPCRKCHGEGRVREMSFTSPVIQGIDIPALWGGYS